MKLEAKTSKIQLIALIVLGIIMIPLGLFSIYRGFTAQYNAWFSMIMGVLIVSLLGVTIGLVARGYLRSVKFLDDEGLVRNDGKRLSWADLIRVEDRLTRSSVTEQPIIWRREVQFRDGSSAWLIPSKVSNFAEVRQFTDSLDCEHATR